MEMAASSSSKELHFVLFPALAPGHMIPIVDLARILAQHGATVTIITSPVNANRFKPVIARAIESKLNIQLLELKLQLAQVGLPQGMENFDMLPSMEFGVKLFDAMDMLEEPAENMLRGLTPAPSCIISDNLFPWTRDVAQRLNIPRLVFHGPGCFAMLCVHIVNHTNMLDEINSDEDYFVLPGLPHRIQVTKPQVSRWGNAGLKEKLSIFRRMYEAEKAAYGIVVNSFEELEPKYVEEFAKAKDKKVWCIGPVSLCNKNELDIAARGKKAAIDEPYCINWLDSKETGSVLFVSFGSLTCASTAQAIELGLGLELTKRPFVWCIKNKKEELERWFLEEGFEERVKGRGLIIHGWAPQVLIMSHFAIGGFITHCGWNSTLEAVSAGLPMVTWPQIAEQFLNERFIVDVLKIGVKIGVDVPVIFGEQEKAGVMVKKEDVKKAVEILMEEEEEEGKERRKRAKELGLMAKKAMEEGGSSYLNVGLMIQHVNDFNIL